MKDVACLFEKLVSPAFKNVAAAINTYLGGERTELWYSLKAWNGDDCVKGRGLSERNNTDADFNNNALEFLQR